MPDGADAAALGRIHHGVEDAVDLPLPADRFNVLPEADGDAGEIAAPIAVASAFFGRTTWMPRTSA